MDIDRKSPIPFSARLVGCLTVVMLMAVPALAQATDISWKTTLTSGTMGGGKFTRAGTAVLGTGETAEVNNEGTDGAIDEKGRANVTVDSVMRFKDGSSITTRYTGYRDTKTLEVAGRGEFLSGTGKYRGITGNFTYSGSTGKTDSVGTYSLKK